MRTVVTTPFGMLARDSGQTVHQTSAGFAGQWKLPEAGTNGIQYNWHRHYDPTLGRYTQPDPLGLIDGPSRYGYALQNPVRFDDPRGTDVMIAVGAPTGYAAGDSSGGIGNPFGHVGLGVEKHGIFSFGTNTGLGSSFSEYLAKQSSYRLTYVYRLPTSPQTDQCIADRLRNIPELKGDPSFKDNCATRSASALKSCGVDIPLFSTPGPISNWAWRKGLDGFPVFKGGSVPDVSKFDP